MTKTQTKKPFNFQRWLKSRQGQQTIIIVLFSIIPLALLFVFTYYPFAEMFKFSFYDRSYTRVKGFVGLTTMWTYLRKKICSVHCSCQSTIWLVQCSSWH